MNGTPQAPRMPSWWRRALRWLRRWLIETWLGGFLLAIVATVFLEKSGLSATFGLTNLWLILLVDATTVALITLGIQGCRRAVRAAMRGMALTLADAINGEAMLVRVFGDFPENVRRLNQLNLSHLVRSDAALKFIRETMERWSEHPEGIIEHYFEDHALRLQSKQYVLSVDGYLSWLQFLASNYQELVCINRTPPVFWFSPRPSDREFVLRYLGAILDKKIQIERLTVMDDTHDFRTQVRNAYQEIPDHHQLAWFLNLLCIMDVYCPKAGDLKNRIRVIAKTVEDEAIAGGMQPDVWAALVPEWNTPRVAGESDPNWQELRMVLSERDDYILHMENTHADLLKPVQEAVKSLVEKDVFASGVDEILAEVFEQTVGGLYVPRKDLGERLAGRWAKSGEVGVFVRGDGKRLAFHAEGHPSVCVLVTEHEADDVYTELKRCITIIKEGKVPGAGSWAKVCGRT